MNLILFGFKASGKTHFGKLLAAELRRPFIDTDDLILSLYQEQTGKQKKVRAIHEELGDEAFRKLEKKTLSILQTIKNSIIALGGGFVLDPESVETLQQIGTLVYLQASAETLKKRLFADELPSFLDKKDPHGSFLAMIRERGPIYASIPAHHVDTDLLDAPGVLAQLRSILLTR